MAETRWLLDGMLGRLTRYLRFMGHDVEYDREADDATLLHRARSENRVLVTRDRLLAARTPRSVLLTTPDLRGQLRALRSVHPEIVQPVRFDRCSLCNTTLVADPSPRSGRPATDEAPAQDRRAFACPGCGHRYWEGSHTDRIRRTLSEIFAEPP